MRRSDESSKKPTPALQVIPIRRWRSCYNPVEIIGELQRRLGSLSSTGGASEVIRLVLRSAIIMLDNLFTNDGFDVDRSEREVVNYFGVVEEYDP